MWTRQTYHLSFLSGALAALSLVPPATGGFLGILATTWFWISIAVPIGHQIYVLRYWRLELHRKVIAGRWEKRDSMLMSRDFSHAHIWVHYCCSEKPDMAVIYA